MDLYHAAPSWIAWRTKSRLDGHKVQRCVTLQCFEWRWTTIIAVLISVVTTNKIEVMNNDCRYIKIIYMQCGEETNIRDPRSYEHY